MIGFADSKPRFSLWFLFLGWGFARGDPTWGYVVPTGVGLCTMDSCVETRAVCSSFIAQSNREISKTKSNVRTLAKATSQLMLKDRLINKSDKSEMQLRTSSRLRCRAET